MAKPLQFGVAETRFYLTTTIFKNFSKTTLDGLIAPITSTKQNRLEVITDLQAVLMFRSLGYKLLSFDKKYIVCPTPKVFVVYTIDFCTIPEYITILVLSLRFSIIE